MNTGDYDARCALHLAAAEARILALGGAGWPRLGSDGGWVPILEARGVDLAPLRPANAGFDLAWSPVFAERFAGTPLKAVALSHGDRTVRGEALITAYGLEGGAVYSLSAGLREAIAREPPAVTARSSTARRLPRRSP
jgi:predicted flavoprotein YhiN